MGAQLPLVSGLDLDDVLAWRSQGRVRVREFLAEAQRVARALPAAPWVINLCEDRYHFAVVFAACLLTDKTSLQPSSHSSQTLGQLAQDHPGAFAVTDSGFESLPLPRVDYGQVSQGALDPVAEIPMVAGERTVAVLFTSGSTGLPQAHGKTWSMLVANGQAEAKALKLAGTHTVLIGTVPVQHSYGFESTFLMALHGGCAFWSGRPFYPQDVAEAVRAVPSPCMVVTTPFHLANLVASELAWPPVNAWLSATAPLDGALAGEVEARSGAPVYEIYGSTESSQLAWRRTKSGPTWYLLPGVELVQDGDLTSAQGGHVGGRVPLSDLIELQPEGCFLLHGRHADLINIAGKRTSLAYLNHQLLAVEGVEDGAFYLPDEPAASKGHQVVRLAAFVVAPDLSRPALVAALRERLDPIFMPRPLVRVDALPRNDMGKLPRSALQSLFEQSQKAPT
jgi:acyl-coenzyme A synthetase/AMP-(fatty) acid ligase